MPFPIPGDHPDPGIKPMSLSPALAGRFFTTSAPWEICSVSYKDTNFIGSEPHSDDLVCVCVCVCACACAWMHMHMLSCFNHVQLFVTIPTIACQAPLYKKFSKQEYWSGLPCPPSADLPHPTIKLMFLASPALAGGFFTANTIWEAPYDFT